MAEFSLKDTLIGGGILFGIGVFIKKVKGKKQVEVDSQDWGGDPDGQLAKALAKVREESKKPREPLKIEKLPEPSSPYYEITVESSSKDNLGRYDFDGITLETELDSGYGLSRDYGEGGDEPIMLPEDAIQDYKSQISLTTYSLEPDWDEDTEEWHGAENTNIWRGTINFPKGNLREGGEFYTRAFGFTTDSESEAEQAIMNHILNTLDVYARERADDGDFNYYYGAETFDAEGFNPYQYDSNDERLKMGRAVMDDFRKTFNIDYDKENNGRIRFYLTAKWHYNPNHPNISDPQGGYFERLEDGDERFVISTDLEGVPLFRQKWMNTDTEDRNIRYEQWKQRIQKEYPMFDGMRIKPYHKYDDDWPEQINVHLQFKPPSKNAETFDAESKSDCPPATKDVAINTKNRNATIKNYGYGPLNVEEPADFWKDIAKQWKTTEKAAKKSKCGNCVAFDRSPRMKDCMPGETSDGEGVLGYCWMHHFKCHSARTCDTWAKGGPITTDKVSEGWGERAFPKTEMKGGGHMDFGSETFNAEQRLPNLTKKQKETIERFAWYYHAKVNGIRNRWVNEEDYDELMDSGLTQKVGSARFLGEVSRPTIKALLNKGVIEALKTNLWNYDGRIRKSTAEQLNENPNLVSKVKWIRFTLTPLGVQVIKRMSDLNGDNPLSAESDEKREVQKYRIGDMKVREYDDGTLERYEAQRIQYDYMVHREPRGTEVDDDGNRIPNPRGGRFTSADAESFNAESFKPVRYHKVVRSGWSATPEPITIYVDKKLEEILKARGKGKTIKYDYNNPIEETSSDWVYVIHDSMMSQGTGFGIVDLERGVSSSSMGMFYDGKGNYGGDVVSFRLVRDGGTYRYEDLLVPNRNKGKKAETFGVCPCGCNGKIEYHDDRGYGCWECARCGEDSDADMGEDCSYCVKMLDMEDNPQNYPSYQAESFDAETEGYCDWCERKFDDGLYEGDNWWDGEELCLNCYQDVYSDFGDVDWNAESFESETVAFESFAGRWNVGQTKEIEGVQLRKVSNARGSGNRRIGAGFIMEYEGHVGEIVANDEAGYMGQKPSFYVMEGGTLGRRGTRRGRYDGISAKDQRECLIRWKHKVGGGTLVIRRPFKKARAIRTSRGFRPYSGVYKPITGFVSKAYTFRRKSDGRTVMGKKPRQNEAWLGIRYDAETLGAEEVNGGYNDCCSSENITVYHWNGANYHDDDKELSYYPAECRVCGVEYDAGLSMYGNSSSIQDLEVSALGAETFDAESKLCESCNQTGNKFYGNTCSKCVYGDQEWCSNCGGMDCKKMPDGDWYCMNFLNNRETYDGRYDAETFEDCEVCYATVDKGTLNDVQAGRICNECHKMNQYEGGTKTIKTPYNAETFDAEQCMVCSKPPVLRTQWGHTVCGDDDCRKRAMRMISMEDVVCDCEGTMKPIGDGYYECKSCYDTQYIGDVEFGAETFEASQSPSLKLTENQESKLRWFMFAYEAYSINDSIYIDEELDDISPNLWTQATTVGLPFTIEKNSRKGDDNAKKMQKSTLSQLVKKGIFEVNESFENKKVPFTINVKLTPTAEKAVKDDIDDLRSLVAETFEGTDFEGNSAVIRQLNSQFRRLRFLGMLLGDDVKSLNDLNKKMDMTHPSLYVKNRSSNKSYLTWLTNEQITEELGLNKENLKQLHDEWGVELGSKLQEMIFDLSYTIHDRMTSKQTHLDAESFDVEFDDWADEGIDPTIVGYCYDCNTVKPNYGNCKCVDDSMTAESFESETVAFESFAGRWNVGATREIEGVRVKKMRNGAFKLDFQGESIIIYDGQFYQINRNARGGFSMGRYDSALNGELLRSGYSEKDIPDNMEAIIRWKHRVGGGRLVIRSPFKKARHIFAGGLYSFTLPGQGYSGVFYPTNRGKTYRFIRRNGEPIVGRFPKKNEAWLDIRYDAETLGAETFEAPSCNCERFDRSAWDSNRCATCGEMRKGHYGAETFSAETFLANEMPFKSFWLVAKKGSKSFPAGQVGELRVYENGERTIVLDNNLIIPFYNQDLAYAYLNEHFMVYPKKGTADKGMLMRAEGDHDDHDHDHEDIDELIEKINRVTDFAITFIHDGGFGGEPKGIVVDEELGLKTEIVNYVEGSIDLRLVRDLETNELVSVRFALTGNPDETPILYLPLPEQLTTVPEEERSVKES